MARRRRSGLANDSRVYVYGKCCKSSPKIRVIIRINNIATFSQGVWVLKEQTVILIGQTLTVSNGIYLSIPFDQSLINNGEIINNGTINISGTLLNEDSGIINNSISGVINNVDFGIIYNAGQASIINNAYVIFNSNFGRIINYAKINNNGGTIDNNGSFYNEYYDAEYIGVINNTDGANIINGNGSATFVNNSTIDNNNSSIINVGIFNNNGDNGLINNKNNSIINNNSNATIYNNSNATIINNIGATFLNDGIINNADGTSLCGIGYINQLSAITGIGEFGTECPPP